MTPIWAGNTVEMFFLSPHLGPKKVIITNQITMKNDIAVLWLAIFKHGKKKNRCNHEMMII